MNFLLILIVSIACQIFAPWWVIGIVPIVVHLVRPTSGKSAFWNSFLGIAVTWLGYGLYLHFQSGGVMSNRIAEIFYLPNGVIMLMVSTLIGGLAGGFSGLAGNCIRAVFNKN